MTEQSGWARVLGTIEWQSPPWLRRRWVRPVVLTALLIVFVVLGWRVLVGLLPQQAAWTVEVDAPGLAQYQPDSSWFREVQPEPLRLYFSYRAAGNESASTAGPARIDLIGTDIADGVSISPAIEGRWTWDGDDTLVFTPENDWPAGQRFSVDLGDALFGPNVRIDRKRHQFETEPFTLALLKLDLEPVESEGPARSVTGVLEASHAMNADALQSALSVRAGTQTATVEIELDQWGRRASFRSSALGIGDEPLPVRVRVAPGAAPAQGPSRTTEVVDGELVLPDRASAFTVVALRAQSLALPDGRPQQILAFEFSSKVNEAALAGSLRLLQLPPRKRTLPDGREVEERWRSVGTIPGDVVAQARRIPVTVVPGPTTDRRTIALQFDAPAGVELVAVLQESFTDADGLPLTRGHVQIVDAPSMPRAVSLVGEGSVLLRSGQRRLSVSSQGFAYARAEIARVRPEAIMQLVSQTRGDIVDVEFTGWSFNEDDIAERFLQPLRFNPPADGSAAYTTLNMSEWLGGGGVFVVTLMGCEDAECERTRAGEGDRRLLVVTDFGLIAKVSPDGSREMFVQSLSGGGPVSGMELVLLGRNGQAIEQVRTDAEGRAAFAAHKDVRRERAPTVIVARRGADIAFLPWDARGRGLNTSRFAIGGDWQLPVEPNALRAEIISQRPFYRPGDTVHLAALIKRGDFAPLEPVPLEIEFRYQWSQVVHTASIRATADGLIEYSLPTMPGWSRGAYSATLYLAGRTARERTQLARVEFQLDEITPAQMRMRFSFEDQDHAWRAMTGVQAQVELENLFGAMAPDRRVQMTESVFARSGSVSLQGWDEWSFRNPFLDNDATEIFSRSRESAGLTDGQGRYRHLVDLADLAEGIYEVVVRATGFEAGDGGAVTGVVRTLVSSLDALVGQRSSARLERLVPGEPARVEFVAVGKDGAATALAGLSRRVSRIEQVVSLVRVGSQYRYEPTERVRVVSETGMNLQASPTRVDLDTATPGRYRLELVDEAGRVRSRVEYTITGDGSPSEALAREAQLTITLDRRDYRQGQEIIIDITAPYAGAGLITIESDRVLATRWFSTQAGQSRQAIRVPAGLEQGAYVTVTMVRAPDSPELFAKPLAYAITPFEISRERRELAVTIESPEVARPGQPVRLRVGTPERARVLVFGVDQGILQLGNVAPPDPLGKLIARPRLAVETLQTADLLLPEFELLQRLLAPGGDMAMAERAMMAPSGPPMPAPSANPFARVADLPAVFWSGIVDTGPAGTSIEFTPPESFNGEMRLVAIAVSESRLGAAHKPLRVRAPFVLMPALLTHATPGDEFISTLLVANIGVDLGADETVRIRVSSMEGVEAIGETQHHVTGLVNGTERRAHFRFRAGQDPGEAAVTYEVSQGDITVRRRVTLSIRPPMPFRATMQGGVVPRDGFTIQPSRNLMAALADERLAVSASPLVFVSGLQSVLNQMPCACTDRIASAAFANLVIREMQVAGQVLPWQSQRDAQEVLTEQVAELVRRQAGSGGFSMFARGGEVHRFASLHAMHLLTEASASGVAVPSSTLNQGRRWLFSVANQRADGIEAVRERALAIYLLARGGESVGAQASQLRENLDREFPDGWAGDISASLLAAIWHTLRDEQDAGRLIGGYQLGRATLVEDGLHVHLLARHFPDRAARLDRDAVRGLVAPLTTGRVDSLAAARAAIALRGLAGLAGERGAVTLVTEAGDGTRTEQVLTGEPFASTVLPHGARTLRLQGANGLYWALLQAGYDAEVPQVAQRNGLEVDRSFLDEDGKPVTAIRQGDLLTVRVSVRSVDGAEHAAVAITDLLPGGFDLQRDSITGRATAVEPGEERVVIFTSVGPRVTEFRYRVRVTAAGRFTVPPIQAESMVRREVNGQGASTQVEVAAAR